MSAVVITASNSGICSVESVLLPAPAPRRRARPRSRLPSPRRGLRGRGRSRRGSRPAPGRPAARRSGDDRSEPARRRDRLEPGDAGAEHEHLCRGDRPGRGHQEWEEPRQPVGGDQRRLVAGHGRLRGERVHRLRARDPRDRLHRERDDAACGEPFDPAGSVSGARKPISTVPGASSATSSAVGLPTRTTASAPRRARCADDLRAGRARTRRPGSRRPLLRPARRRTRSRRQRAARPSRGRARPGARRLRSLSGRRPSRRRNSTQARKGTGSALETGHVGSLLATFSAALEARDPYLRGHSARVTAFAEALARRSAGRASGSTRSGSAARCTTSARSPSRHGAPQARPLTERSSPRSGGTRSRAHVLVECVDDFRPALPSVLHHHERWDGTGYPHGLEGDEIPLEARVLGVADAFDAMTSAVLPARRSRRERRSPSWSAARAPSSIPGSAYDVRRALGARGTIAPAELPVGIAS